MRYKHPIKQILLDNRHLWDHPQTRPSVRENFQRVLDCRTPALGAEVYASETSGMLEPVYGFEHPGFELAKQIDQITPVRCDVRVFLSMARDQVPNGLAYALLALILLQGGLLLG